MYDRVHFSRADCGLMVTDGEIQIKMMIQCELFCCIGRKQRESVSLEVFYSWMQPGRNNAKNCIVIIVVRQSVTFQRSLIKSLFPSSPLSKAKYPSNLMIAVLQRKNKISPKNYLMFIWCMTEWDGLSLINHQSIQSKSKKKWKYFLSHPRQLGLLSRAPLRQQIDTLNISTSLTWCM